MNRLSRVAAAINLRASDPLTESGHDPVAELRHYYGTVAGDINMDWAVRTVLCAGKLALWGPCRINLPASQSVFQTAGWQLPG